MILGGFWIDLDQISLNSRSIKGKHSQRDLVEQSSRTFRGMRKALPQKHTGHSLIMQNIALSLVLGRFQIETNG